MVSNRYLSYIIFRIVNTAFDKILVGNIGPTATQNVSYYCWMGLVPFGRLVHNRQYNIGTCFADSQGEPIVQ